MSDRQDWWFGESRTAPQYTGATGNESRFAEHVCVPACREDAHIATPRRRDSDDGEHPPLRAAELLTDAPSYFDLAEQQLRAHAMRQPPTTYEDLLSAPLARVEHNTAPHVFGPYPTTEETTALRAQIAALIADNARLAEQVAEAVADRDALTAALKTSEAYLEDTRAERDNANFLVEVDRAHATKLAAQLAEVTAHLAPLVAIANAYDDNALDNEARKTWGMSDEHTNKTPPERIELYSGRGGRQLLTLADCLAARTAIEKAGGKS